MESRNVFGKHQRNIFKEDETNFDAITVIGGDQNIKINPQRAAHLHNVYTAVKGLYEKNRFRKKTRNPSIVTTFNKLAQKLSEYERETGVEIDDGLFVMALFMKFGKNTFPGHLLVKSAIEIYEKKLW